MVYSIILESSRTLNQLIIFHVVFVSYDSSHRTSIIQITASIFFGLIHNNVENFCLKLS